jgi:far upstream element-binding protein
LAIAAKFGLGAPAGDGDSSALGKRKLDGDAPGLGLQKKEKIFVPVMEHPDINWLGLLIGPRAATIKAMTEKSGAKISIRGRGANKEGQASGHPEDDEDLHVTIEGSEEALAIARREVEAIVLNPEQAMKIKEQQLADLADMKNLSSGPAPGGEVSIYGPGAGAEYTESLDIPNSMVGLIIGKGGEMIQRLQLQCGCKMQVCKEDNNPAAEGKRRVTMNGLPERVSDLRNSIERLVAEKVASLRAGGGGSGTGGMSGAGARSHPALTMPVVMQVPVPDDKIGVVIGRGGSVIRAIQEKTGAQIHIPPGPDEGVQGPLQRTIRFVHVFVFALAASLPAFPTTPTHESVDSFTHLLIINPLTHQLINSFAQLCNCSLKIRTHDITTVLGRPHRICAKLHRWRSSSCCKTTNRAMPCHQRPPVA